MSLLPLCLRVFIFATILASTFEAGANQDIYELAATGGDSQLQSVLAKSPRAWDTGDDYLGESPVGIAITTPNLVALKRFVAHGYDLDPDDFFDHPVRLISPFTGRDTPEHIEVLAWILGQIDSCSDIGFTLKLDEFVQRGNYAATQLLLEAGVDPNRWIHQWYSVWDRTADPQMRELLEAYGATSNFRKLILWTIFGLLFALVVLRLIFRAKPEKSNHSDAPAPERNATKGAVYVGTGMAFFLGGALAMLLFRYGSVVGLGRGDLPLMAYGAFFAVAALGIRFISQGKKLRTKDGQQILDSGKRPIFLYLRSFILDEEDAKQEITLPGGLSAPINPWETGLSTAFGKVGDLIGIGRPGEKLATTGAARLYVTDDEWQDKVIEMVAKADIVVWTYGATEGLRWEIKRLVNDIPPEKLVVAMPFWDQKLSKRKIIWEGARKNLNAVFPKPLPETVGNSLFVTFAKDWTASWVETQPPAWGVRIATLGFWNPLARGVRGLLRLRGYDYPATTVGEKIGYAVLALMGWTVLGVILVMMYGLFIAFT